MKGNSKESALYLDATQPVEKRVEDLLSRMTLDEKIAQLSSVWVYELLDNMEFSVDKAKDLLKDGIGQITRIGGASNLGPKESAQLANEIQRYLIENTRLGIPALVHEESCSGYMAKGATCFPQTIGVASTWNTELVKQMGSVIREQMKAVGAHQALAPLMDVARDARWGRVEETFGEDPYLISEMGVSYIEGLQGGNIKDGIMATVKHFVGYGFSEGGMNWAPAHIPERELREVFLLPFEAAVKKAKTASVMAAYHELDGIPCHGSKKLLTQILRNEWGFDGLVVSDYFGVNMLYEYHHVARDKGEAAKIALQAGVDIELPSRDCYGLPLKEAVQKGLVEEALIDEVVRRILRMKFLSGVFENPYVDVEKAAEVFDTPDQRKLAYKLAQQSIVLLKNQGDLLPLKKDIKSIAVIGPNADSVRNIIGDYAYPCHIESLVETKEQSNVFNTPVPDKVSLVDNFVPIKSILEGIKGKISPETELYYAKGCEVTGDDKDGFAEAIEAAKKSDVAIVVVGDKAGLTDDCTSGESRDRADLNLPGVQQELVEAIYNTGTPTVVVLVNGRPLSINWISQHIPAIIEAWLPGEEGAAAVADVLFGDYNPGGKLPVSFPRSVGQVPVYYNHKPSGGRSHWKGDYVEMSTKPLYPFGYGLSYTKFEFSNLEIAPSEVYGDGKVRISVDVQNAGKLEGDEVVQLYVRNEVSNVTRPVKELKGFKRVSLRPGEKKKVVFELSVSQLGFYDEDMRYVVQPGTVKVMIGSSSEDIKVAGEFKVTGKTVQVGESKEFFTKVEVV
ncbi:glycoside hydrolase family 3 N-terminal domain-containing protein [Caldanaerobius polysaccharolyticus]|uniref:glycoside hydrolase family 3 N-terminal domain-containing protein n=1 Tax=Caldanaerobius polysaccharolyticus TaxID=44256 RepID=UPI00054F4E02|nr:glycoside hydrolase family 3 N-terminal domain-containing protein [Caldanaerobius polysaccharolyticus]